MVPMVFSIDVILLISSNAELYSVSIWSNLAYIFWHLPLDLATNNSIWVVPSSFAILNVPHLLSCDFLTKSSPLISCYLGYISFLPYIWSHLVPMIIYCPFPVLGPPLILWCYSFWFSPIFPICSLLVFFNMVTSAVVFLVHNSSLSN